jgi:putative ABC transport system permease protein
MKLGFAVRLALREGRHSARKVGVYMLSITLGVGALVAIHSFRADVARSVRQESAGLMGADARLDAGRPFPDPVAAMLDSVAAAGVEVARVTQASSMVVGASSGDVRLLQVRGVSGGFPFYGEVATRPGGRWRPGEGLPDGVALADPAVLTQLRVEVGDTLVVGRARLPLVATVQELPSDLGFPTAIAPRVFVSRATLDTTGLLAFGSLARYEAYLRLPARAERTALRERYEARFTEGEVDYTLAEEQAQSLANGIRFLGRFLGLVGLGALLLGGVGVASAIHVYVRERQPGVAVLRCLGARQGTVFLAYLLQAAGLGLAGAAAGVVVGVAAQQLLPSLLADALPVRVTARFSPASAAAGLGIGVWVAVVFALIPLLQLRDVPPLRALRADVEGSGRRWDLPRLLAVGALAASVVGLCVLESPDPALGVGFAVALGVAVALLWGVGWGLTRLTRRLVPAAASYPVRQGVSNLFRPHNQTVAVTLALGFGAFVVGTVLQAERSLVADLTPSFEESRPNVLLFDIQPDQVEGVRELVPASARPSVEMAPLVSSRLVGINGRDVEELRTGGGEDRPEGWALRREYRNTWREELGGSEELVAGRWWDGTAGSEDGTRVDAGGLPRLSLETGIAEDLAVGLGDTLIWEVAGVEVPSVVTSLRRVDWSRLEPNFFAVFEPGALEEAPWTAVMVARIPGAEARAGFQRSIPAEFPNVSALDFARVQEAIDEILARVRQAVGFLGAFSAFAGVVVLVGSLASSRLQRMREAALLKTLGARRRQLLTILFAEYVTLGTLATAAGLALSWIAAALAVPRIFEVPFRPDPGAILLVWGAVAALTVVVGLAGSRTVLRRPPLAVLRDQAD